VQTVLTIYVGRFILPISQPVQARTWQLVWESVFSYHVVRILVTDLVIMIH